MCGSDEDFLNACSALLDITPYVVLGIKSHNNGGEMKCMADSFLGVSDSEEINEVLRYVYGILRTY